MENTFKIKYNSLLSPFLTPSPERYVAAEIESELGESVRKEFERSYLSGNLYHIKMVQSVYQIHKIITQAVRLNSFFKYSGLTYYKQQMENHFQIKEK